MAVTYPPWPNDTSNYMLGYGPVHHNMFPLGQPVTMLLFQDNGDESAQVGHQGSAPLPTSYRCYDIDGNSWTGNITYSASTERDYLTQVYRQFTIAPPAGQATFACGWYRVRFYSSYNNPDMPAGASGETTFMVVNTGIAGVADAPNWKEDSWPRVMGSDEIMSGLTALGPYRYSVRNTAGDPTSEINELIAHAPVVQKWWVNTATPNRPRRAFVDFPDGTVECMAVYSNSAGGQGRTGDPSALNVCTLTGSSCWIQISNGTNTNTKRVTISQPQNTAVETYDNLTTWWNVMDAINNNSTRIRAWSNALTETAKNVGPVQVLTTTFNNVRSTVQQLYPHGYTVFGGPWNEPDDAEGGFVAMQARAFKAAVKLGNANALVQGPNIESFNSMSINWLDFHLSQLPANFYDIIGVHGYNTTNGDMQLADKMLTNLRTVLTNRGYANTPVWMTEGGFLMNSYGPVHWRRGARWLALWYLLYEAYGIPRDNISYYYPRQMGYFDFPFFTSASKYKVFLPGPGNMFLRGFYERTPNSTFYQRLSFTGPAADMFFGGVWREVGVSQTVVLLNNGMLQSDVTLAISGVSSVDVYDWAGNKTTQTVSGGQVKIQTYDLPVYVMTSATATISVAAAGNGTSSLGQNLVQAVSKTFQEPVNFKDTVAPSNALSIIANNAVDPDYTSGADNVMPYRSAGPFPHEIKFKWPTAQQVSRVQIFFAPPWQYRGTPKQFRVDTWNGSSWVTQYSFADDTMTSDVWISPDLWLGLRETWWKEQWVWDIPFSSTVSTVAVRLVIVEGGYGGEPDEVSMTNMGQGWDVGVTIREIKIF